jgi:argininosuccinate synthase
LTGLYTRKTKNNSERNLKKEMKKEIKKVVLAYSGGLDTSIIIPWLKENFGGCEVIAVSGDVGQGTELDGLEEKALKTGASKLYIEDLNNEFVYDFIFPTLKAGAVYEGQYLLGTSFARPVIAKRIVEIALKEGADAICHGCTGKGNDQVRFELTIKAFAPEMEIIAPWRIWDIKSRDEEIDYAEAHNIPLKINRETNYSKDKNLWHLSHEGLDLEDPANEPQYDKPGFLELGVSPEAAPDTAEYITLTFEKGIPVALNGQTMNGVELIKKLNELGGKNGIGLTDIVENRLVGMKSRGVYETPGGTILYRAHEILETITLDKATSRMKQKLAIDFADLVYNGQWYTPVREALSAFVDKTQENVTGDVKLKLYKGNIIGAGVTSLYTLYDEEVATFDKDEVYDQNDSAGFINLFGLPIKVKAMLDSKRK